MGLWLKSLREKKQMDQALLYLLHPYGDAEAQSRKSRFLHYGFLVVFARVLGFAAQQSPKFAVGEVLNPKRFNVLFQRLFSLVKGTIRQVIPKAVKHPILLAFLGIRNRLKHHCLEFFRKHSHRIGSRKRALDF